MQVIVVGGGIIGLATAVELAGEGHLVQLLERERPGQRASWVAAGLLTPSSPWKYPPELIGLCRASEALWPELAARLARDTGVDPEYERRGMVYPEGVGFTTEQVAEHTRRRRELGFDVVRLDRAALDAVQPGLGPDVLGAAWQERSARVRPPRVLAGLRRLAERAGVAVVSGCEVAGPTLAGGRITGVRLASGQALEADAVVLAAGAWSSGLLAGSPVSVDVRPVRGQILLLAGPPGTLEVTVNDGDGYLVPRRDGRILVGSSMEDAGFDAVTSAEVLDRLRRSAAALLPATRRMTEEMAWAGLRPGTPDRLPYLGPVADVPGLLLATGHFRNGILLAPVTARIVADVLAGRVPPVDLSPFLPRPVDPGRALVSTP